MDGNYIKICRSILDWEWYRDDKTVRLFLHCLLKANWKDGRFKGVDIPRGSFATSIPSLANDLGMSYQSIRTAVNHLKSTGELTVTTHTKFSVFTVNNYCKYQDINNQSTGNQQAINRQSTGNQQLTNNNRRREEGKKGNKKEGKNKSKGEPVVYYPNDEKLNQAFADYVDMRKQIKEPMTEKAITMAQNKLKKLASNALTGVMDNDKAIEILNEATMHNWKGLYPLKEEETNKDVMQQWRDA